MQDICSRSNAANIPGNMQESNSSLSELHSSACGAADRRVRLSLVADAGEIIVAKFNYHAQETHELTIAKNERLVLLDDTCLWWKVKRVDSDDTG